MLVFDPASATVLPETHALLQAANLHPHINQVVLHGSHRLARRVNTGSNIYLSLLVDAVPRPTSTLPWTRNC